MDQHQTPADSESQPLAISTALCLCAGFGGLERGARMFIPSIQPVCCVEREAFAAEKLAESMEKEGMGQIPVWSDLRTFDGKPWRRAVDWVIAGFPCQGHSLAGSRLGSEDYRNLWPDTARIIGEVEPDYVLLENVPGILSSDEGGFMPAVLHRLQEMGYEVACGLFTAEEVGATHKRERVFIFGVRREVVHEQHGRQGIQEPGSEFGVAGTDVANMQNSKGGLQLQRGRPRQDSSEFTRCHEELANNNNNTGLQGHGRHDERGDELPVGARGVGISEAAGWLPLFPPGPDDWDAWLECLLLDKRVAPALTPLHMVADGLADDRAAWLRLTGNGVVDLQAAYALATLWSVIFHGEGGD